ncbi:MAG: endonuclease/exonuclease/phosphatase family protein [Bacteroidales bacterium]
MVAKRKNSTRSKHKPSAGGAVLRIISIVFVTGFFISLLAPYVPPDQFWVPAFAGLAFPVFFILNVFFLLLWIFRRRWFSLFHLALFLWSLPIASRHLQLRSDQPQSYDFYTTIISYNVKTLLGEDGKSSLPQLLELITHEKPDILCLQEFRDNWWQKDDNTLKIMQRGGFIDKKFESYYPVKSDRKVVGIAIFSKYPIVGSGSIRAGQRLMAIYADVILNHDTIRIFSMHLQSIAFQKEDYQLVEGIMETSKSVNGELETGSRQLMWKLRKAFIKRAYQSRLLSEAIAQSPYPVVVCGDMNDTPSSYAYRKVRGNLQDAFQQAGHGVGNTYLGKLPKIRIDYIFLGPQFKCLYFDVLLYHFSDHYPVSSKFYLKKYD